MAEAPAVADPFGGRYGDLLALKLLMSKEGFRAKPYNDPARDSTGNQEGPDVWRIGYGSDTITLPDGTVVPVTSSSTVTQEQAQADLARRVEQQKSEVIAQIGEDAWKALPPNAQAALTSLAYNYGSLSAPYFKPLLEAAKAGDLSKMGEQILARAGDNGGINASRREQEAGILEGASTVRGSGGTLAAGAMPTGSSTPVSPPPPPPPAYNPLVPAQLTAVPALPTLDLGLNALSPKPGSNSLIATLNSIKAQGASQQ